jgi:LPXTG-site transpeptidase (sortase) family protein
LNELASLGGGDLIEVSGWGSTLTYRVVSVEVVSKSDLARRAEEIFNQSGPGRLVLITCEDWDGTTWRSNVVTVAAPA